jgi:hypothetical protein
MVMEEKKEEKTARAVKKADLIDWLLAIDACSPW